MNKESQIPASALSQRNIEAPLKPLLISCCTKLDTIIVLKNVLDGFDPVFNT